jgi:lipid-A-disaccharide synthase
MKVYVIAGEASGDLHGSNLMRAMLDQEPSVQFRFWGGDHMAQVAGEPVKHIRELAFMGFVEVVMNLRTILGNIRQCKMDIAEFQPDAIVLIDYPGFNLRIAEWAHAQGIKVLYYISPQIWAWKQNRVHKIKQVVDRMYCILPFEQEFYGKFGVDVDFVGHPLIDAIENYRAEQFDLSRFLAESGLDERPVIALLPGSRKQEISIKLPIMLEAADRFAGHYQIVVAGAPSLPLNFYTPLLKGRKVVVVQNKTYDLLSTASAAMVTSGTATLETALFKVPEVVCYKGSTISYQIARRLIKVPYISLVNLIMNREVVKELIQHECNADSISNEMQRILPGGAGRDIMLNEYDRLIETLGGSGASAKTAKLMLKTIQER